MTNTYAVKLEHRLAKLQKELRAVRRRLHHLEYLLRYNARFTQKGGYRINVKD